MIFSVTVISLHLAMIDFLLPYCLLIRHLNTEMVFVFTSLFKSASPAKDSLGTTSAPQLVISALAPRWQNVRHGEVYIFNYSGMPLCISTGKLTKHSPKPAPSSAHMLHTHTHFRHRASPLGADAWRDGGRWQRHLSTNGTLMSRERNRQKSASLMSERIWCLLPEISDPSQRWGYGSEHGCCLGSGHRAVSSSHPASMAAPALMELLRQTKNAQWTSRSLRRKYQKGREGNLAICTSQARNHGKMGPRLWSWMLLWSWVIGSAVHALGTSSHTFWTFCCLWHLLTECVLCLRRSAPAEISVFSISQFLSLGSSHPKTYTVLSYLLPLKLHCPSLTLFL